MNDHTYYAHLGDAGQVMPAVVDRDDGSHLLADADEVVAWLAAGNALQLPPVDLRTYAASVRYARETAGIKVGTAPIATDRDSQGMITGAWAAAQMDPTITIQFKTGAGFVPIGAAQVQAIARAVVAHVQACFAVEAQVDQAIASGTVKTAADVDAAFAAITA